MPKVVTKMFLHGSKDDNYEWGRGKGVTWPKTIQERELISLPDDEWQVRSTGQVRKRTGWSPDGKFYRCACDYDNEKKVWNRHQGTNTRCLFVPMRMGAR